LGKGYSEIDLKIPIPFNKNPEILVSLKKAEELVLTAANQVIGVSGNNVSNMDNRG
jgi:hypothetical protein